MPFDASFFQGLAGPQRERPRYANPWEGPFSQYLRPPIPQPIDIQPKQRATGWEPMPAAIGQIALGFLQGVRQRRVADYLEREQNTGQSLARFQDYVGGLLRDPQRLTPEGRRKVEDLANQVLREYTQYTLRDAPKDGVAGWFGKVLTEMTGGPIKGRKEFTPEALKAVTGEIAMVEREHSQDAAFKSAAQAASQALNAARQNRGGILSAEEAAQIIAPYRTELVAKAPGYVQEFDKTLLSGYPGVGSWPYMRQVLAAKPQPASTRPPLPTTEPPPASPTEQITQEYLSLVMPAPAAQQQPPAEQAPQPAEPLAAEDVRSADTGFIAGEPGSPERYAVLAAAAAVGGSPIKADATPEPVTKADGTQTMGVYISGSPNPEDNGWWDSNTRTKIEGPVVRHSIQGDRLIDDEEGYMLRYNQRTGKFEYVPGPEGGERVRRGRSPVAAWGPGGVTYYHPGDALGMYTGPQTLQWQQFAEHMNQARRNFENQALRRLNDRVQHINMQLTNAINRARSGQIEIATGTLTALGGEVDPAIVKQAQENVEPFVQEIEKQRKALIAKAQQGYQAEIEQIYQSYGPPMSMPAPAPTPAPQPKPDRSTGRLRPPSDEEFDSLFGLGGSK